MEEFKKIIKPNLKINNVVQPIKAVTIPTYNDLAKATLSKDKYLSEFSTEKDKRRVRENLGIGNNFKVVGEYDTLELLQQNVPVGNEYEAYLVGSEIYTWSDALKKWFRYGAAGSSAYEIAVANGYEGNETQWLETLGQDKFRKIDNYELLEPKVLYDILESTFGNNDIICVLGSKEFQVDVSKSNNMYILTFWDDNKLHIVKVVNDNGAYLTYNSFVIYGSE